MTLGIMDRVFEESTTTGTSDFTLSGASNNYVAFATVYGLGAANTFPYTIENRLTNEWETGIGYLSDANTLVRDRVVASSNANSKVSFAAGSKRVYSALNSTFLQEFIDARITPPAADAPDAITDLLGDAGVGYVNLLWTAPYDGGSAITSYTVEYKLDTEPTVWTEWTGTTPIDETITVSGLTEGADYNFRVTPNNAVGAGGVSNIVDATVLITQDITDVISTGLVAFFDGKIYTGTGPWKNQIAAPADGETQVAYDVTPTNTTLWTANQWTMNNSAYFQSDSIHVSLMDDLHKTQAGNEWTLAFRIKTPLGSPQLDNILGTAAADGDFGIELRVDSSGALKIDQYNGTTHVTKTLATLAANTLYDIIIGFDYDASATTIQLALNADVFTPVTSTGWTDAITTDATDNFILAAGGDEGGAMESGAEITAVMFVNRLISDAEVAAYRAFLNSYYSPPTPVVPEQVFNLYAAPGDGQAYLGWQLDDNGGSPITDYLVEYKLTSSGTWSVFSHSAQTLTDITVTGLTNGQSYDFRVSGQNSVGTGTASATASCSPEVAGADPYDLTPYKITEQKDDTGSAYGPNAREITQPALLTYNSAYFYRRPGELHFVVFNGGATTSSSAVYTREELRHLEDIAWNVASTDEIELAVLEIPAGHKTIVHQIHGNGFPPWFKTHFFHSSTPGQSYYYTLVKNLSGGDIAGTPNGSDFPQAILKTGLDPGVGSRVKLKTEYTGTALKFYVDDVLIHTRVQTFDPTYAGTTYYWKRGNYYQNANRDGQYSHVVHYTNANNYIGNT